jgi:hypothetical protein
VISALPQSSRSSLRRAMATVRSRRRKASRNRCWFPRSEALSSRKLAISIGSPVPDLSSRSARAKLFSADRKSERIRSALARTTHARAERSWTLSSP